MNLTDIFSLSDFQRRTRAHIRRLQETGRPAVLTVNGRAELVVHDAGTYQRIADKLERARECASCDSEMPVVLTPDPIIEEYKLHVDRTLLRENLRRTIEERVANLVALQALTREARRAGEAAQRRSGPAGGAKVGQ